MKKIICILLLFATSAVVHSASFSLENKSGKSEEKPVSSAAVYKNIIATGYGLNEEQARANAFKSAIEQYIGVVVDSEARMKNGDLIKESILTASNGFIQEYKQLSSKNNGGLFEVTVNAVVKSQKVIEKIKSLNIAVMEIKGAKNIQARLETKKIAKEDAEKMFRKVMPPLYSGDSIREMLSVKINSVSIEEEKANNDKVPVKIEYSLVVNYEVYKSRVQVLERLFKNLGGKLYKRIDFPYFDGGVFHFKSYKRIRSLRESKSIFGIVKKYGGGYVLDVWAFPIAWEKIYPFNVNKSSSARLSDVVSVLVEVSSEDDVLWANDISPWSTGGYMKDASVFRMSKDSGTYFGGWWGGSRSKGINVVSPVMLIMSHQKSYGLHVDYSYGFMMPYKHVGKIKSVNVEIESSEF